MTMSEVTANAASSPRPRASSRWLLLILLASLASGAGACQGGGTEPAMAPLSDMPIEVQAAPVIVQEAYRFAAANPEVLSQLPCYCGCGAKGHTSNYDCYFTGTPDEGLPAFDLHSLGCSICVDITQDAMRLLREGKSLEEIRAAIDATYSRFGPSNMPAIERAP